MTVLGKLSACCRHPEQFMVMFDVVTLLVRALLGGFPFVSAGAWRKEMKPLQEWTEQRPKNFFYRYQNTHKVFLVDGGGGPQQPGDPSPSLVPCWSFPPAQERVRSHGKKRGYMGVSPGLAMVVLMLFLLVFAALGFEAYQIYNMQVELREMREVTPVTEFDSPQKQIGHEPEHMGEHKDIRPAAHVIGRIETAEFRKTLRWEPRVGRAFLSGAVAYRYEDGALQVNETGLYHIYSRVELIFKDCSPTSVFLHSVFVRRKGRPSPLTLMEAHRAGFCSQQRGHAWTTESYLASALQLQESDRVFVNVSHPTYLSHAHYANFFGLYKI